MKASTHSKRTELKNPAGYEARVQLLSHKPEFLCGWVQCLSDREG